MISTCKKYQITFRYRTIVTCFPLLSRAPCYCFISLFPYFPPLAFCNRHVINTIYMVIGGVSTGGWSKRGKGARLRAVGGGQGFGSSTPNPSAYYPDDEEEDEEEVEMNQEELRKGTAYCQAPLLEQYTYWHLTFFF